LRSAKLPRLTRFWADLSLADDTGLRLHAWNGLPGALVSWLLDAVGTQGILAIGSEP